MNIEAKFVHLLLLIFAILDSKFQYKILKNYQKSKNNKFKLSIKPFYLHILYYLPFLSLLYFNNKHLEHFLIIASYLLFYNKIERIFDTQNQKSLINKQFPLICIILILAYNYSILPRSYVSLALTYAYIGITALIGIYSESLTEREALTNVVMSHLLFCFSKIF